MWAIPLRNKHSQTITQEYSNKLTTSKRKRKKLESDRGSEWYIDIFQNFLKAKNIHHYSRFIDKSTSIAELVIRTIRSLVRKPVFEKGRADWLSDVPSVIKQYINTIHHSKKMNLIQASKKSNKRKVYSKFQDRRIRQQPKSELAQFVRTVDIKRNINY